MTATIPIHFREGKPAIDVKDRVLWAHDPRTADLISELSEAVVDGCYELAQTEFWTDAGEAALDLGYGEVFASGRSGGWLIVEQDQTVWTDYLIETGECVSCDDDPPEQRADVKAGFDLWVKFRRQIEEIQRDAEEAFVEYLTEAIAELEAAREANEIRSIN